MTPLIWQEVKHNDINLYVRNHTHHKHESDVFMEFLKWSRCLGDNHPAPLQLSLPVVKGAECIKKEHVSATSINIIFKVIIITRISELLLIVNGLLRARRSCYWEGVSVSPLTAIECIDWK